MIAVFGMLLPVFALMGLGYLAGLRGWLGPRAVDSLNLFVVRLALPAQLFLSTARTPGHVLMAPGFLAIFAIGCIGATLAGGLLDWLRPAERRHRMSGAVIEGLCAGYGNTAFIGIPVCLAAFGPQSMAAVTVATLVTVCALFACAITLVEVENAADGGSASRIAGRVLTGLARNPLVMLPIAGAFVNVAGWGLPAPIVTAAAMLGAASSPCALVTIGLFLANTRSRPQTKTSARAPIGAVARVVGIKLLVQPSLTWLSALLLHVTDRQILAQALVLAALPTGTGPFMLARLYDREAAVASRAILFSTVLSAITLGVLLTVMR